MKFLSKLDPMTLLMLIVIFGVVITMSTQAATKPSGQPTTQAVDRTSTQILTNTKVSSVSIQTVSDPLAVTSVEQTAF